MMRLSLVLIALALVIVVTWPAQAAMLLSYFSAVSTNSAVNLEWGTFSEVNVEGFTIYMKEQGQPDTAYHVMGTKLAKGGQDVSTDYSFSVTQDMNYGTQYCFRLEESTTDGSPGEQHDICGFGPGVTPTPVLDPTTAAFAGTLTPIVITPPPGAQPPPTLITPVGQSPLGTPMDTPSGTPSETPSGTPQSNDITDTPTPTQSSSPIDGSTPTPTQQLSPLSPSDAEATANAASASNGNNGSQTSPLETPSPTSTETPFVSPTPSQTVIVTPPPTDSSMAAMTETAEASSLANATSMYVVQTATSTPEQASPTPTLTPLPTVTPTPELGLLGFMNPSTQNMVVLMLCLIFLSATGLGSLGLLIAVLYYRSQNQRRF